jgi:hypothetical protein
MGVTLADIGLNRRGKPGEIVEKERGRLAVPAAGLFRLYSQVAGLLDW